MAIIANMNPLQSYVKGYEDVEIEYLVFSTNTPHNYSYKFINVNL